MKNNQKGFTLIELLVVVAIIGLLSTLAVVSLGNARQKSRDARRVSDVKQIQTALELYFNDVGSYPATGTGGLLGSANYKTLSYTNGWNATGAGTIYMASVPLNPTPADSAASGCGGSNYTYAQTGTNGSSYTITYCLGGATGGIAAGLNRATPAGVSN